MRLPHKDRRDGEQSSNGMEEKTECAKETDAAPMRAGLCLLAFLFAQAPSRTVGALLTVNEYILELK